MQTPWAILLCKFKESDVEPFPVQYYKNLFTTENNGSPWNMIRYFREYSHNDLDLTGSKVFGWYKLDKTVDDYNGLGHAARDQLIKWARQAAAAAGVDLSPFYSVVVCANLWEDIGASQTLSGVVSQGAQTPTPRLLAHEMCHIYGLKHSRVDGSDEDYRDPWDVMSAANNYSAPDDEFTLIGPGLNAWNMRSRGWLDESRVWKSSEDSFDETVKLRPLERRNLGGYLAAELPGGYLAEFRVREGWDGAIPRPAVLVHRYAGGHSYLMQGNSGDYDLAAGDSFGDAESDPQNQSLPAIKGFDRLDVISIDAAAPHATIRLRHRRALHISKQAVDPMSLILPGRAYLIWVEKRHPHVPKVADIVEALRSMSPEEQNTALARARRMAEYGKAFEEAAAVVRKSGRRGG